MSLVRCIRASDIPMRSLGWLTVVHFGAKGTKVSSNSKEELQREIVND